MSNYITREQAMICINAVFTELNTVERQLSIRPLSESESELGEILELINVFIVKLDKNYHDAVKFLSNDGFIQYYGKICQLAEALKLDIYKEIKNKTKLKALAKEDKRYYYYTYHYEGNSVTEELTESSEQMDKLVAAAGRKDGTEADKLRDKIKVMDHMVLEELFEMDEDFMNITLRDFLNLKEDGTMDYDIDELTPAKGWKEATSIGSQYHQTKVPIVGTLNAKFVHEDGREVVMNSGRNVVTEYPDKGTYNYVIGGPWGGHKKFDMDPYFRLMENGNKEAGIQPANIIKRGHFGINNRGDWPLLFDLPPVLVFDTNFFSTKSEH